jgi:uncharacterized protein YjbI with pentapeptide repeats
MLAGASMIEPLRAAVRPRVRLEPSGEAMLLEDVVGDLLATDRAQNIILTGELGSGTIAALRHLAHRFPQELRLRLDEANSVQPTPKEDPAVFVEVRSDHDLAGEFDCYRLTGWGRDEWIEYLLSAHRDRCASVMRRIQTDPNCGDLEGNPSMWRHVLNELAADEELSSIKAALRKVIVKMFPDSKERLSFGWESFLAMALPTTEADKQPDAAETVTGPPESLPVSMPAVVFQLVADAVVNRLIQGDLHQPLTRSWPRPLIAEVAPQVAESPALQFKLRSLLTLNRRDVHPLAASLLHASGVGWKPDPPRLLGIKAGRLNLSGAFLAGAEWSKVDLTRCELPSADFGRAKLDFAKFDGAIADGADFSHADLQHAILARLRAFSANFHGANLSAVRGGHVYLECANLSLADLTEAMLPNGQLRAANLSEAILRRAILSATNFAEAVLDGADFTDADLEHANLSGLDLTVACFDHARFTKANLGRCCLEGMELPGAVFIGAELSHALLTGSIMPQANFAGANLQEAGMADIDWEIANLRDADLRRVSFHMGSTRDGLVGSTIPMHGSRTGFYTDDYNDQDFKAPEEIRKANLRGADLRGANIENTDFYLVDLRDALYDAEQEQHFRRCGAILESKAE